MGKALRLLLGNRFNSLSVQENETLLSTSSDRRLTSFYPSLTAGGLSALSKLMLTQFWGLSMLVLLSFHPILSGKKEGEILVTDCSLPLEEAVTANLIVYVLNWAQMSKKATQEVVQKHTFKG